MKSLLVGVTTVAICASALTAFAADGTSTKSDWIEVSSTDTHTFSVRKGSFEVTRTKGGSDIAVVLGQATNRKSKSIEYRQWYVSKDDCLSGLGKLVMLDTKGTYVSEVDFVAKGDSAASGIADAICSIYLDELKKQQDKGI